MAPRDSEILTERDPEGPAGAATPFPQPPVEPAQRGAPLIEQPGNDGPPAPMPTIRPAQRGLAVPPGEFDMIASDDDLQRPIGEPQPERAPVQEPPREARVTEQDQPDPTLLDQQRQQQQKPGRWQTRRQSQRLARIAQSQENEQLRQALQETQDQLQQLAPRIDEMTAQQRATELANINNAVAQHQRGYLDAKQRVAEAFGSQDAAAFTKALEDQNLHLYEGQKAINRRDQIQATARVPATQARDGGQPQQQGQPRLVPQQQLQQRQAPAQIAPEVADFIDQFHDRYPWAQMNGDGFDPYDYETVRGLDTAVARLGYDPAQPEYWEELERQMQTRLPHRFGEGQQAAAPRQQQQRQPAPRRAAAPAPAPQRRGPAVSAVGDAAPRGGRTAVYISPERKNALIQAGALDSDGQTVTNEPKLKRLLAGYDTFDRANGVGQYARRTG